MVDLNKEQEAQYNKIMSKVNLSKDREIISEHAINLSKCMVNLSKHNDIDLGGQVARVITLLDYSGSMISLYKDGTIQKTLDKLMPIGLSFDDNGEIEMYIFSDTDMELPVLTINNYSDYQTSVIGKSSMCMTGTQYCQALKSVFKNTGKYKIMKRNTGLISKIKGEKADTGENVFVIFITDGEPSDKISTKLIVDKSSNANVFIQFIGIGNNDFRYLQALADFGDRKINNIGFADMGDLRTVRDEKLYNTILSNFSKWLKEKGKK